MLVRHRRRRLLRPPVRRQDRHDRQLRRRLVLRLHPEPRGDDLGRLPAAREIPMLNVHGIDRLRARLPGGRSGGSSWRAPSAARARSTSPSRRRSRTSRRGRSSTRSQYVPAACARRPRHAADDACRHDRRRRRRTGPATGRPLRPPRTRRRAAARAAARASRCSSPSAPPSPGRPGSKLVPRHGGHPTGSATWTWIFLGCELGALAAVPRRALAAPLPAAAARRRRRGRRRGDQLAPLGAPLLLSTDAWTYWDYGRIAAVHHESPYRRRRRARSRAIRPSRTSAPAGGTRRRSTGRCSRSRRSRSALAAGSSASAAAWIYKVLGALAVLASTALWRSLLARGGRSRARSWAGTRCSRCTSPAAATTTPGWRRSCSRRSCSRRAAASQAAGAAWAAAVFVKWVPLLFLPLRALEARATGRRVGTSASAITAIVVPSSRRWRYGTGLARRPRAAGAQREPGDAVLDPAPTAGPRDAARGRARTAVVGVFAAAYCGCCWEAPAAVPRLGLAARALAPRDAVARGLVRGRGRPARGGRGGPSRRRCSRSRSACYLVPQTVPALAGSRRRRKTSTPSSLEHELPGRVPPQAQTSCDGRRHRRDPVGVARLRLVGRDPGRVLEIREAEHAPASREMGAERVRRADDGTRRDRGRAARAGDPVVRGHVRGAPAASRRRERARQNGSAPRSLVRRRSEARTTRPASGTARPRPAPRDERGPEDACADERGIAPAV